MKYIKKINGTTAHTPQIQTESEQPANQSKSVKSIHLDPRSGGGCVPVSGKISG